MYVRTCVYIYIGCPTERGMKFLKSADVMHQNDGAQLVPRAWRRGALEYQCLLQQGYLAISLCVHQSSAETTWRVNRTVAARGAAIQKQNFASGAGARKCTRNLAVSNSGKNRQQALNVCRNGTFANHLWCPTIQQFGPFRYFI